jgi:hypothetical protein
MCLKHTCISPHDLVDAEKALSRTNFQELIQSLKSIATTKGLYWWKGTCVKCYMNVKGRNLKSLVFVETFSFLRRMKIISFISMRNLVVSLSLKK